MSVLVDIYGERFAAHAMGNDTRSGETRLLITLADGVEPKLPTVGYGMASRVFPCWVRVTDKGSWSLGYFHAAPLWIEFDYAGRAVITLAVTSKVYWRHGSVGEAVRREYRAVSGELVQRL